MFCRMASGSSCRFPLEDTLWSFIYEWVASREDSPLQESLALLLVRLFLDRMQCYAVCVYSSLSYPGRAESVTRNVPPSVLPVGRHRVATEDLRATANLAPCHRGPLPWPWNQPVLEIDTMDISKLLLPCLLLKANIVSGCLVASNSEGWLTQRFTWGTTRIHGTREKRDKQRRWSERSRKEGPMERDIAIRGRSLLPQRSRMAVQCGQELHKRWMYGCFQVYEIETVISSLCILN